MSRAFIKEDEGDDELPDRPLPSGPNYVTPRGLELLREKVRDLQSPGGEASPERKRDLRYFRARLGSAVLVDNSKKPPEDIRFGAAVEARDGSGAVRRFMIVGQDEAQEGGGKIAWDCSLARDLIGRRVGDRLEGSVDGKVLPLVIASVDYP